MYGPTYAFYSAALKLYVIINIYQIFGNMLIKCCMVRKASYYKQRIAGKSLPMEKFMIRRCARYQAQGGRLVLPAVELLCLWNMFPILAKNERGVHNVLKVLLFLNFRCNLFNLHLPSKEL